jgi:hypothetical protein
MMKFLQKFRFLALALLTSIAFAAYDPTGTGSGGISPWVASTNVAAGSYRTVFSAGTVQTLVANTQHVTDTSYTNTEAAGWTLSSQTVMPQTYPASTYIPLSYKFQTGGIIYERSSAGISAATFDAAEQTNWRVNASVAGAPGYQTFTGSGTVTRWGTHVTSTATANSTISLPDAVGIGQDIPISNRGTALITVAPVSYTHLTLPTM